MPDDAVPYEMYLRNMLEWFRSRWDVPDLEWSYDNAGSSLRGSVPGMRARFWVELEVRGTGRTYFPTMTVNVNGFDEGKMTASAGPEIVAAAKRGEYLRRADA